MSPISNPPTTTVAAMTARKLAPTDGVMKSVSRADEYEGGDECVAHAAM